MSETKARLKTDKGDIVIEFCPDVAPKHVENFKDLTRRAQEVADGNLEVTLRGQSDLSAAFRVMLESLRETIAEL